MEGESKVVHELKKLFTFNSKLVLDKTCKGWNEWSHKILHEHRIFRKDAVPVTEDNKSQDSTSDETKGEPGTAQTESCKSHDKKVFEGMMDDTIHSVAATDEYVAWASKKGEDFRIYISCINEDGYKKPEFPEDGKEEEKSGQNDPPENDAKAVKPEEFRSLKGKNSMIGAMRFARTVEKENLQLVCVDQQGYILWLDVKKGGDLKELVPHEKGKLNAIDFHSANKASDMILAVGRDDQVVQVYLIDPYLIDPSDEKPKLKKTTKFLGSGRILDVCFLNHEMECSELAVADSSGLLAIYKLETDRDNEFKPVIHFMVNYDLNVEPGTMLSSSDDGDFIVVGCGDHRARVLKRIHLHSKIGFDLKDKNNDDGKKEHDFWEETASFVMQDEKGKEKTILGVDICGEILAVATEGSTEVFNIALGCKLNHFSSDERIRCLALYKEGQNVVFGSFSKKVHCYNISSGFKQTFHHTEDPQQAKEIQSVSIDDEGSMLAIGTMAGHAILFKLGNEVEQLDPIHSSEGKAVYVVKLSPDGKLLAVGDYNCTVTVYNTTSLKEMHSECYKNGTYGPAFIWGLDFLKLDGSNAYRLAVGCWDGHLYLYDFDIQKTMFDNQKLKIHKTDQLVGPERIYDVCFSDEGKRLCMGGRFYAVHVYALNEESQKYDLYVKITTEDRLYCTALSPNGRYLATGGFSKKVDIYDLDHIMKSNKHIFNKDEDCVLPVLKDPEFRIQSFDHADIVQRVDFMDNSTLAAISKDGICGIYDVARPDTLLMFKYPGEGNSVASSGNMMAVAYGCEVSVYGQQVNGYTVRDRVSVELAAKLLNDKESLCTAVAQHPTLPNAVDSSHSSLLHIAVKEENAEALEILLNKGDPVGLFKDDDQDTPLILAIKQKWRHGLELLMDAVNKDRIVQTTAFFASLFTLVTEEQDNEEKLQGNDKDSTKKKDKKQRSVLEILGERYPDILVRFFADLKLSISDESVLGNITHMPLVDSAYIGLGCKSPKNLWSTYYNNFKEIDQSFNTKGPVEIKVEGKVLPIPGICGDLCREIVPLHKRCQMALSGLIYGKEQSKSVEEDSTKERPRSTKANAKNEVISPFHLDLSMDTKDRTGRSASLIDEANTMMSEESQLSPLEVIIQASKAVGDYRAIQKGTVVYHLILYKWYILFPVWKLKAKIYFGFVTLCILQGMFVNDIADLTLQETYCSAYVLVVLLSFFLGYCSLGYMREEVHQLMNAYDEVKVHYDYEQKTRLERFMALMAGLGHYFKDDWWNVIDMLAFPIQLATDICVIFGTNGGSGFSAVSILLVVVKINTFLRGWKTWGPFVRMIQRIIQSMAKFLCFWLVLLLGFAFAFYVLLDDQDGYENIPSSFYSVLMVVYGDFDDTLADVEGEYLATFLFQILLFFNIVMMLNLLVAILSDGYSEVVHQSEDDIMCVEIPSLIIELEKQLAHPSGDEESETEMRLALFPKWVHILEAKSVDSPSSDEKLDKLMDLVEKLPAKIAK